MVARWAHNPKVVGSNPASATIEKTVSIESVFFYIYLFNHQFSLEKEYGASDFFVPLALLGSSDIKISMFAPFIR